MQININDFPSPLHFALEGAHIYDSSCHSGAVVLYSDLGYYIKIDEKEKLCVEARLTERFSQIGLGAEYVCYLSEDRDYLVTREVTGQDMTHYLDEPELLCKILAESLCRLHDQSVDGLLISLSMQAYTPESQYGLKRDTLIHGDACLPNLIMENGRFRSFIDVGQAGVGDRHIDLYWAIWSLQYNLGTDAYTDLFLDLYGRGKVDEELLRVVAEVEASYDDK